MPTESWVDQALARFFHLLGFKRCSKCYLRVRRAQVLWYLSAPAARISRRRRLIWRQLGWPERFELRRVDLGQD